MPVPRKVKAALERLGISGVVNGYITAVGDALTPIQAAFTGWDAGGKVICVLYCASKGEWQREKARRTIPLIKTGD